MNNIEITPDMFVYIINSMANGHSPTQVAADIGLSKQKFQKLVERPENEDLRECVELGMTKYEAYMERVMSGLDPDRPFCKPKEFKENGWKAFMAKHFGWANKSEVKENSDLHIAGMDIDDLNASIDELEKIREL